MLALLIPNYGKVFQQQYAERNIAPYRRFCWHLDVLPLNWQIVCWYCTLKLQSRWFSNHLQPSANAWECHCSLCYLEKISNGSGYQGKNK